MKKTPSFEHPEDVKLRRYERLLPQGARMFRFRIKRAKYPISRINPRIPFEVPSVHLQELPRWDFGRKNRHEGYYYIMFAGTMFILGTDPGTPPNSPDYYIITEVNSGGRAFTGNTIEQVLVSFTNTYSLRGFGNFRKPIEKYQLHIPYEKLAYIL